MKIHRHKSTAVCGRCVASFARGRMQSYFAIFSLRACLLCRAPVRSVHATFNHMSLESRVAHVTAASLTEKEIGLSRPNDSRRPPAAVAWHRQTKTLTLHYAQGICLRHTVTNCGENSARRFNTGLR